MSIINFSPKIGQKVRICTQEELIKRYPEYKDRILEQKQLMGIPCFFTCSMYQFLGRIVTIDVVKGSEGGIFSVKENSYYWDTTVTVPLFLEGEIDKRSLPYMYRK